MSSVKILSDSTCDLSPELIKKYDIDILPLYINLGGTVLKDGIEVTPQKIFDYVDKTGVLPGTIGVSVEDFRTAFEKWHGEGFEVICHTISGDMSGSLQNAMIAADGMEGVHIVDSRNLSTGVGHVVVNAAVMAQQGMAAAEIIKELNAIIPKVRASFILDNLDYMKKGGRCSAVALLGANLLKIKPTIIVEDGKMHVGKKYRGLLKKVLEDYVDEQLEGRNDIRKDRIFITHTGCTGDIIDDVRGRILKHMKFDEIIETHAGATITSHCGPNTLGILFLEK